jgi:RNase adaptor protein for sRNA GlmZ degradation
MVAWVHNVRATAPFFDATRDDPVERFVEETRSHPVFKLTASSGS